MCPIYILRNDPKKTYKSEKTNVFPPDTSGFFMQPSSNNGWHWGLDEHIHCFIPSDKLTWFFGRFPFVNREIHLQTVDEKKCHVSFRWGIPEHIIHPSWKIPENRWGDFPKPPKRYLYLLETVGSSEVGIQCDQMHEIYNIYFLFYLHLYICYNKHIVYIQ